MSARVVAVVGSGFVPCPATASVAAASAVSCPPWFVAHRQLLELRLLLHMIARLWRQMRYDWTWAESLAVDHQQHCRSMPKQRCRRAHHRYARNSRRLCHRRRDPDVDGRQLLQDSRTRDTGTADRDRKCAYLRKKAKKRSYVNGLLQIW